MLQDTGLDSLSLLFTVGFSNVRHEDCFFYRHAHSFYVASNAASLSEMRLTPVPQCATDRSAGEAPAVGKREFNSIGAPPEMMIWPPVSTLSLSKSDVTVRGT
jgi:hypothetical protein